MLFVQVFNANGDQEVGKISKQWSGFVQEYFTDADNFGVNCNHFPMISSRVYNSTQYVPSGSKYVTQTQFSTCFIKNFDSIQ